MATVLVADHNAPARALVTEQLSQDGHRVVVADDGIDAVATIRRYHPDIAVIDTGLPGVSGITVWHMMRAYPSTAHTPVIMLAAADADEGEPSLREAPLTEEVVKPVGAADLANRVRALLTLAAEVTRERAIF